LAKASVVGAAAAQKAKRNTNNGVKKADAYIELKKVVDEAVKN
jgi:hypothetical protein